MSLYDILSGLASAVGPAGAEGSAARLAMELLGDYVPARQDEQGSVVAEMGDPNAKEHILLDAHIDEIGMIVTFVDDDGFVHIDRCGGSDRRTLIDAEVVVFGEKKLPGVVCCMPPHLTKPEERSKVPDWDKIYIDIGYNGEKAKQLVPPGSRVVVKNKPARLLGGRVCAKSLDDRAGCAALIRVVELLHEADKPLPCHLTVLLSVQEETGFLGSVCSAYKIAPTQAIAVDVGFATQPGAPADKCGELGKGPQIACSPTIDFGITKHLRSLCAENGIEFQHDIMNGRTGTNGDAFAVSRGGIRTGVVSIPVRSMHTAVETLELADIENTAKLLAAFVMTGGAPDAQ